MRWTGQDSSSRTTGARSSLRNRRILLGGGVLGLLLALAPSLALAAGNPPRPDWNPGAPWAPLTPASPEMLEISNLFWVMLVLSAIVFVIVAGAIGFSVFRFTAKPGQPEPTQVFGNRTVEVTWTLIPFVVLIVAFGFTVHSIHDINTPPKASHPLNIIAMGHQWWWEFDYPTLGVTTANELHIPAGREIHFHVESADVIHSFWIPRLQRQIDANPGQDNAVFVQMPRPGVYDGACYEYCGTGHAWMKFRTIVQPQAAFNAWVKHQLQPAATPKTALAALGKKLFLGNTCVQCHAISGTSAGGTVGPNLTHVGSRWAIAAGAGPMT